MGRSSLPPGTKVETTAQIKVPAGARLPAGVALATRLADVPANVVPPPPLPVPSPTAVAAAEAGGATGAAAAGGIGTDVAASQRGCCVGLASEMLALEGDYQSQLVSYVRMGGFSVVNLLMASGGKNVLGKFIGWKFQGLEKVIYLAVNFSIVYMSDMFKRTCAPRVAGDISVACATHAAQAINFRLSIGLIGITVLRFMRPM